MIDHRPRLSPLQHTILRFHRPLMFGDSHHLAGALMGASANQVDFINL
jgi:hypothetical protein